MGMPSETNKTIGVSDLLKSALPSFSLFPIVNVAPKQESPNMYAAPNPMASQHPLAQHRMTSFMSVAPSAYPMPNPMATYTGASGQYPMASMNPMASQRQY